MEGGHQFETLLLGGTIRRASGMATAGALLIRGGRIAAVGNEADVRAQASPGHRVERVDGCVLTAGFTDAHVHLTTWALTRRRVALAGAGSIDEAVRRVAERAETGGSEWVLGQGWNRHLWDDLPTREHLDRIDTGRPIFLDSQDIHAAWLNSEALRRCEIDRGSIDPDGGTIVRDARGEPTGLLLENARSMALHKLPVTGEAEIQSALREAQSEAHRLGLTGVHSVETHGLADFSVMEARGELRLRVLQHIQLDQLESAVRVGIRSGFGSEWLRIGGVKMFLDGSLGSRTAWLREPYEGGSASDVGIQTLSKSSFRGAVELAARNGLPSTIHAIGDAAVELALRVLEEIPAPGPIPHRIEHVQLCPPDLWARAGRSGIIGSMQPVHLLTDISAAERHWGHERSRGAYPFAALREAGMPLVFGSDVPVETLDPRPGLFAARRRVPWSEFREPTGAAEWYPEHNLSGAEAVQAYTETPALAAGLAGSQGKLLPGFHADVAVWNFDPVECDPDQLSALSCQLTIVAGEVVHRAEAG